MAALARVGPRVGDFGRHEVGSLRWVAVAEARRMNRDNRIRDGVPLVALRVHVTGLA